MLLAACLSCLAPWHLLSPALHKPPCNMMTVQRGLCAASKVWNLYVCSSHHGLHKHAQACSQPACTCMPLPPLLMALFVVLCCCRLVPLAGRPNRLARRVRRQLLSRAGTMAAAAMERSGRNSGKPSCSIDLTTLLVLCVSHSREVQH